MTIEQILDTFLGKGWSRAVKSKILHKRHNVIYVYWGEWGATAVMEACLHPPTTQIKYIYSIDFTLMTCSLRTMMRAWGHMESHSLLVSVTSVKRPFPHHSSAGPRPAANKPSNSYFEMWNDKIIMRSRAQTVSFALSLFEAKLERKFKNKSTFFVHVLPFQNAKKHLDRL